MKIFWTDFAKNELRKIFEYYKVSASYSIASKIVNGISKEVLILTKHPLLGQTEEFLTGRDQEYRYLVFKNYKIIYWVNLNKNSIEITDVFDTRQNPTKMVQKR